MSIDDRLQWAGTLRPATVRPGNNRLISKSSKDARIFATLLFIVIETGGGAAPRLTNQTRWYLLRRKEQELRIRRAFEFFREHGIEPILIKGWAAARLYPPDRHRNFSDIDLSVSVSDFDKAHELVSTEEGRRLDIDLHREFRQLERSRWTDIFSRSELIDLDGTDIRVPSPEDHLRILSAHWLTDGGANKEKLWDVYYAVENRQPGFDWSVCLDAAGPVRRNWTLTTIGVAHTVLDLNIDDLPFAREVTVPEWMMKRLEDERKSGEPLQPLHTCLRDRRLLFKQIRKRLPPNPIQATVDMEGIFDDGNRVYYQTASIFVRLGPSLKRFSRILFSRGTNI